MGGDLLNGTMTVEKAKVLCSNLPECVGMTFAAEWEAVWAIGLDRFRVQVWLKGFDECPSVGVGARSAPPRGARAALARPPRTHARARMSALIP